MSARSVKGMMTIALLIGHVSLESLGNSSLTAETRTDLDSWQLPARKEDFHVFLLMGQSNMAGGIKGEHLLPEDKEPVPHIVYIPTPATRNFNWRPAAHPLHVRPRRPQSFGLGLPFAQAYIKHHPGVNVGLIPVAYGGHSIDLLNKGSKVYEDAMSKARFAAQQAVIKGVLWHQGEADTVNDERANAYEAKLHRLIADIRNDLQIEDLPFIVGDLGELYGIGEHGDVATPDKVARIKRVRAALRDVPKKVKNIGFVETTGLTYSDASKCTHFDRASYIVLGQRYCEAYARLTAGGKASALSVPVRVACVGDSITAGARIRDRSQKYPAQLAALLGESYDVRNFGVNGATLLKKGKSYRRQEAFQEATAYDPDIVIVLLGTNDTKPQTWVYKDDFEADCPSMIDHFEKLPSHPRILVCYPVPIYPNSQRVEKVSRNTPIREVILPLIDKVAHETGVQVVDLHSILSNKTEMFPDHLHPNADGARLIAETIKAAIIRKE